MTDNVVDDDWVMVDAEPKPTLFQTYKKKGQVCWRLYKKAALAYKVYQVVKMCVNIYILLHAHNISLKLLLPT
jgi:hypothetical protein